MLVHHIDIDWLRERIGACLRIAPRVWTNADEYAGNLEVNLRSLFERAKSDSGATGSEGTHAGGRWLAAATYRARQYKSASRQPYEGNPHVRIQGASGECPLGRLLTAITLFHCEKLG